jgi:DNA-binding NtrC family response regulator
MRQVRSQVALAATGRANVLIVGPVGSGRRHVARTIYALADLAAEYPLSMIACTHLNAEQFDAQWNSAIQRTGSRRDVAGGTVLLTDVDLLATDAQRQLARQLNGPSSSLRVLATATTAPQVRSDATDFSADLACSLATLTIHLPPLNQRIVDLPLLAQAFLEEQNVAGKKQLSRLTVEALEALAGYHWPGNVAELAKFMAEAHAKAEGPFLTAAELPKRIRLANEATARPKNNPTPIQLETFLAEVETELIRRALTQTKQNKSKAAELLGLSRQRLLRRMVQLEID